VPAHPEVFSREERTMSLRREPGRVVLDLKTSHVQTAAIVFVGAVVGVVLFLVLKPFVPDLSGVFPPDASADSVSWSEAPRFDVAVSGRPSFGAGAAPVTIVEFTDYGCPFCRRHALEVLPALMDTLGTAVEYVVRHFPIPALTPNAIRAAIAAECAFQQGLFWAYKEALQGEYEGFQDERLRMHAAAVGLDQERFDRCLVEEDSRSTVERDILDAWKAGVTGTPTFFINGKRFQGARPLEELVAYVRLALLEADLDVSISPN
jgi:predicted DsbA family dithiol-disulfide isomerase